MEKLQLETLVLGTPKTAPKVYQRPVAKVTPQFKVVKNEDGETRKLSSGCISFPADSVAKLGYLRVENTPSRVTLAMALTNAVVFESGALSIDESLKKQIPVSGVLRVSGEAVQRLYSKHGLDVNDSWVFELVDGCLDLPGVDDLKVLVLKPLEKRA